jgi:hypothetical protein
VNFSSTDWATSPRFIGCSFQCSVNQAVARWSRRPALAFSWSFASSSAPLLFLVLESLNAQNNTKKRITECSQSHDRGRGQSLAHSSSACRHFPLNYYWPYEGDTYALYFYYRGVSQRACYKLRNRNIAWWCIESISISHSMNFG